jgi:hypothetical protein
MNIQTLEGFQKKTALTSIEQVNQQGVVPISRQIVPLFSDIMWMDDTNISFLQIFSGMSSALFSFIHNDPSKR